MPGYTSLYPDLYPDDGPGPAGPLLLDSAVQGIIGTDWTG